MDAGQKYKDAAPIDTVQKIRNILMDLGILTTEHWMNSVEGVFSLRVNVVGTQIGTNGKGTTEAYALASAYAEFMERLQNHLLYFPLDLSPELLTSGSFALCSDEKYLSLQDILDSEDEIIKILVPEAANNSAEDSLAKTMGLAAAWLKPDTEAANADQRTTLAKKWKYFSPPDNKGDFLARPYYSVRQSELTYVPYQMSLLPYGSHGMCAGNTPAEAIGQGLCEIFERYSNCLIAQGKVIPPSVPTAYLQTLTESWSMIQRIEQRGGYRIIVKDCSLGQGYPVVAVIAIDAAAQKYFVKFGSHLDFSIALERCLTELLQGRNVGQELKQAMTHFTYEDANLQHPANWVNISRTGNGSYPHELFGDQGDYPFQEFHDVSGYSNQDMVNYLAKLLLDKGYDILVRDASFLGFPTYHMIVPGFSEIFEYDEALLNSQRLREEAKESLRDLANADASGLRKIISFLVHRMPYVLEGENITRILQMPLNVSFPWHRTPNYLFMAQAFFKMGKTKEALGMMKQLTQLVDSGKVACDGETAAYYRCVHHYLQTLNSNLADQEPVLRQLYPGDLVNKVLAEWHDPAAVFSGYGRLNCWDCSLCSFKGLCVQETAKNIHLRLKDQEKLNPVDQYALRHLFPSVG